MGEWHLGLEKGFGKVFSICNVFVERHKKIKSHDLYLFYEVEVLKNIIIGGMNKCKFELQIGVVSKHKVVWFLQERQTLSGTWLLCILLKLYKWRIY